MDTNFSSPATTNKADTPTGSRTPVYDLHIDDTGTRHLDRLAQTANTHPKWFALGGVLVAEEDEAACKAAHNGLYSAWPSMRGPLHITDMQARRKDFAWLERLPKAEQDRFWAEYRSFLAGLPVLGTACVIHRPGYLARGYCSRSGDARWDLCRTAFNIVVERAAKVARMHGRRLRVNYEGSNPSADQAIRGYFALLKNKYGLGFSQATSSKYSPLDGAELAETLIDLERKDKRAKLMQIADTFVYAIARGRYEPELQLYKAIAGAGRLVSVQVGPELAPVVGEKFYCFDGV